MKLNKLFIATTVSIGFLSIFGIKQSKAEDLNNNTKTNYNMTENIDSEKYNVIDNEKSKELQNAIKLKQDENNNISKEDFQQLLNKYEGAQRTFNPKYSTRGVNHNGFTEEVVKGGLNYFASSSNGLAHMRDYMGGANTALVLEGAGIGAYVGGPAGALVGAMGAELFGKRCGEAYEDSKAWIEAGSNKGGVRLTATAEFPIDQLSSIKQTKIRKL